MVETKFQTSFIPKQPVTEEVKHSGGGSILFLVGFLFLIAGAAAAVGVTIWGKSIEASIKKGEAQLKERRAAFNSSTIDTYTRLDARIDAAENLLKNHIGASALFSKLAENTLKTVRFNNFSYTNSGGDKIIITMSGEALDYESMALQAKWLTDPSLNNAFKGPIFSNFNKVKDTVVFTFASGINPYVVDYYSTRLKVLEGGANAPVTLPANVPGGTPVNPVQGGAPTGQTGQPAQPGAQVNLQTNQPNQTNLPTNAPAGTRTN